jgi:hypothetical protein
MLRVQCAADKVAQPFINMWSKQTLQRSTAQNDALHRALGNVQDAPECDGGSGSKYSVQRMVATVHAQQAAAFF